MKLNEGIQHIRGKRRNAGWWSVPKAACVYTRSIHATVYLTACASQYAKYTFDIQYHERNNMQIIIDYYYY